MSNSILIQGACLVNEGAVYEADLRIVGERIDQISKAGLSARQHEKVIKAKGLHLIPGMIDDQVHFREPGLSHKADIHSESRAAVAGGITSFMEMPNTIPNALTQELLEDKYQLASKKSFANYSFYMGASNDNIDEVLKTNPEEVCGVKVFMGSSTGNMLVDEDQVLENIFKNCSMLIATHCEDENTIRTNMEKAREQYGEEVPIDQHPLIRSEEACYLSSSKAVALAKKHGSRLHVLHISTAKELGLFRNDIPLKEKKITAEACIHHLWFSDEDYKQKGAFIKWNPAVKSKHDRAAIRQAVRDNIIDVIATDHAPHTLAEKDNTYFNAPSGGPLVEHALPALFELQREKVFSLAEIVNKTSHAVADLFGIQDRGYLREGYFADLVLVNLDKAWEVSKQNVLAKCAWSPFEGQTFHSWVDRTFVNGNCVYEEGTFDEQLHGKRLKFKR